MTLSLPEFLHPRSEMIFVPVESWPGPHSQHTPTVNTTVVDTTLEPALPLHTQPVLSVPSVLTDTLALGENTTPPTVLLTLPQLPA